MISFIDKNIYGETTVYTFDIISTNNNSLGKAVIIISNERHDAGLVFKKEINTTDVYDIIEDFRHLLDLDLIEIDEVHKKIILAEITYR